MVYDLFKQGAYEGHRYCESLFVPDLGGHKRLYCGHRRGAFQFFPRRDICARHRFINSRKHDFTAFSDSKRISRVFKYSKGAENAKIYFRHLRLYHSCYFNFGASCDTRRVYRKTDGIYNLNMSKIFSSPNAYSFIGFAILSTLFLSSLLLADVSNVAEEQDAYRAYRKSALITGPISLLFAVCIMVTMRNEANWLYSGMMNDFTWIIASFITFVIAGIALFLPNKSFGQNIGKPRLALVAIGIQYFLASYAYGRAHLPYMIYPDVTVMSGFTEPATFRALFATYIVAFIILFPGFFFFWKMFMRDKRYIRQEE